MLTHWGAPRAGVVLGFCALIASLAVVGCKHTKDKKIHYIGEKNLNYYKDAATKIEYPHVHHCTLDEVTMTDAPRTLEHRRKDEVWDLTLVEAIHTALMNNRIIRSDGGFLGGNSILANPGNTASVYDPAIQESGVLFGGRGVEAALADFDTTFSTSMLWGRNESVQNSPFSNGVPGATLSVDSGNFIASLRKQFATGGSLQLSHNWDYSGVSSTALLFPSSYTGSVAANYRHPLLAGSGVEFTRIAGPVNPNFGGITGVSQGVVIARINNDITLAQFENNVRNLVRDVERLYWDLYLAYRTYDTSIAARNSALRSWREGKAKLDVGGAPNFKPADEAQAKDQFYLTQANAKTSLNQIYTTEVRFRRLLGLAVNDGRVIRPVDEPTSAQLVPSWQTSLAEALMQRYELRAQKWNIKSLELQLRAAKSLTRPQLDFVSGYRVNGFGDTLWEGDDNDGITRQGLNNAYETLTEGDQTGWNLGFEFSMPIGFRSALAQVRNYELRLAKAREVLATQELEISHELAVAFQDLTAQYATAQDNFNRRQAAVRRVALFEIEEQEGTATLDLVLRAQSSLADAEVAYFQSLTNYNKAIVDLHYRKGTLLENYSIYLAEGQWTPAAYSEALRRARARSNAFDNKKLLTEPEEFVLQHGPAHHVEYGATETFAEPPLAPTQEYDDIPPAPEEAGDAGDVVPQSDNSALQFELDVIDTVAASSDSKVDGKSVDTLDHEVIAEDSTKNPLEEFTDSGESLDFFPDGE